jgi:hypothetical protein
MATVVGVVVANAGVERFDKPLRHGWPGGMKCKPTCTADHSAIAVQANSGLLSHRVAVCHQPEQAPSPRQLGSVAARFGASVRQWTL